jgi:5,6-dimethylbenzimidazole synthase
MDTISTNSIYQTIMRRRDVRGEFTGDPIPPSVLLRLLGAAHAAPSVGLTQPWDFIVVESRTTRERFRQHVLAERETFAATLALERAARFAPIKIEGILESSSPTTRHEALPTCWVGTPSPKPGCTPPVSP